MFSIVYVTLSVPMVIGLIISVSFYLEKRKEKKESILLKKRTYESVEKEIRKSKLKIPGYYEDFFCTDKDEHIVSVHQFLNSGMWL